MKVEMTLTLVKGNGQARTNSKGIQNCNRGFSSSGIKLLISQENQQARRLDPSSLTEARSLLLDVSRCLSGTPKDMLPEVHLLDSSCLIRLT